MKTVIGNDWTTYSVEDGTDLATVVLAIASMFGDEGCRWITLALVVLEHKLFLMTQFRVVCILKDLLRLRFHEVDHCFADAILIFFRVYFGKLAFVIRCQGLSCFAVPAHLGLSTRWFDH